MIRRAIKKTASRFGYEIRHVGRAARPAARPIIPRQELYQPLFAPWHSEEFKRVYSIAAPRTLVSIDRCYVICMLLRQSLALDGDVVECGVYQGGTAAMIARIIGESGTRKKLFLFDTFCGMPETDASRDLHRQGDFADTSAEKVEAFVNAPGIAVIRKGFIPETFAGLESCRIAFAHIDVDIYKSILDSLEFLWPRLSPGGFIVFDDYGFPTCPGARQAVDDFFAQTPAIPLCLQTGQALVFKH